MGSAYPEIVVVSGFRCKARLTKRRSADQLFHSLSHDAFAIRENHRQNVAR